MKIRNRLLLLAGLMLIIGVNANAQQWRKIVPLKSTRAEVERLLGPNDNSYGVVYELKTGALSIEYSSGPCRKDRKGGWNVSDGVVVSFSFAATKKPRETDLRLNRKQFRRVVDTHTPSVLYYINDKDGVTYEVQRGRVHSVEYYPPKRYDYLYCGDAVEK
jgi:hypothetical protein